MLSYLAANLADSVPLLCNAAKRQQEMGDPSFSRLLVSSHEHC
jgi:hypothetical protein